MPTTLLPVGRLAPDWRRLFPEIDDWITNDPLKDRQSLTGDGLALSFARTDTALALAEFSWPSFVVIDDMVLRGYRGDGADLNEAVAYWMACSSGDKSATESMLNHEHFWPLVQASPPTAEAAMHWGALVREMWAAKLARDFPDRRFEVALHTGPDVERMDHQITFYQLR